MTLLIVFNDGTERRIENVMLHEDFDSFDCFAYTTNSCRFWAFIPKKNVKYFGPEELWVGQNKTLEAIIKELEDYIFEDPTDDAESAWNNAFRRAIRTIKEKSNEEK